MSQREAWIWMIAEAAWKARSRRFGSIEVDLKRGQLAASSRFLAGAWGWKEPRVRRYLDSLEQRRMVERSTDAGITVITICNYDDYQGTQRDTDAAPTHLPTHLPTQRRRSTDAPADAPADAAATQAYTAITICNYDDYQGTQGSTDAAHTHLPTHLPTQRRRSTDAPADAPADAKQNPSNIGGGGGARARVHAHEAGPTFRERILLSMGLGPDGIVGASRFVGGQGDMAEAARWLELPGLTEEIVIEEISRLVAAKRDGPPGSFRYFTPALTRLSGQLTAPPLSPDTIAGDADEHGNHRPQRRSYPASGQRRPDPALADIARIVGLDQA